MDEPKAKKGIFTGFGIAGESIKDQKRVRLKKYKKKLMMIEKEG